MGEVPFHHVYIHPKMLDGFGETMSQDRRATASIRSTSSTRYGTDALRFGMVHRGHRDAGLAACRCPTSARTAARWCR